ncbi:glycosyltransferase, partial [Arcobacteraceae bacterium]|nr:glycosyltransferase [Arcobacteraceae bacterium]
MKNKLPILTIAIPTYNRADSLRYLVEKISPYLNNNLKLLILDNNSTDNTKEYINIWNKDSNISGIKHITNLGGVVNMLKSIELAQSKYVWLLGDDDDIDITYINELVNLLSSEEAYSLHLIPKSREDYKIHKHVFNNKIDFINSFYDISALHLMSSSIYNAYEARKYLADAYRLVHLQHAFSLFHSKFLEEKKIVKILKLPILKRERITDKRWSRFTAHLDALETTYLLFGKDLLNQEYKIRKNKLLRIAVISLFENKNEGFQLKEVIRLIR